MSKKSLKRKSVNETDSIGPDAHKRIKRNVSNVKSMVLCLMNDVYDIPASEWNDEDVSTVLRHIDTIRRTIIVRHGEPDKSSFSFADTPPFVPREQISDDEDFPSLLIG